MCYFHGHVSVICYLTDEEMTNVLVQYENRTDDEKQQVPSTSTFHAKANLSPPAVAWSQRLPVISIFLVTKTMLRYPGPLNIRREQSSQTRQQLRTT